LTYKDEDQFNDLLGFNMNFKALVVESSDVLDWAGEVETTGPAEDQW